MFKNLFGKKDGKGGGARMPTGGSQLKMTTQRRLARGVDCNSKTASVHIYFIIIFPIYGEPKRKENIIESVNRRVLAATLRMRAALSTRHVRI